MASIAEQRGTAAHSNVVRPSQGCGTLHIQHSHRPNMPSTSPERTPSAQAENVIEVDADHENADSTYGDDEYAAPARPASVRLVRADFGAVKASPPRSPAA